MQFIVNKPYFKLILVLAYYVISCLFLDYLRNQKCLSRSEIQTGFVKCDHTNLDNRADIACRYAGRVKYILQEL